MNDFARKLSDIGYCHVANFFKMDFIDKINNRIDEYLSAKHDGIAYETGSKVVRAIHGPHLFDDFFLDLAKNSIMLKLAKEVLNDEVYIHQYKINMKLAMEGKSWPWHQDYIYWNINDFIDKPNLLNIAVALDDISLLHGPLCFVPGSHKFGDLTDIKKLTTKHDWRGDVSSDLTYQISQATMADLLKNNGFEFIPANAGDIIAFDPQLVHCSSNNMSAGDRKLMIITMNAVGNAPKQKSSRPSFLSATNYTAL